LIKHLLVTLLLGMMIMANSTFRATADDNTGKGGVFRMLPTQIEGRIGEIRVLFERNGGGAFSVFQGESENLLAHVSATMKLIGRQGEELVVRQEADSNPHFFFLEEGPQRIGLRVIYTLYDQNLTYHGEGLQEVWIYPNGDLFCSVALRLTDNLAQGAISNGWLETKFSSSYDKMTMGTSSPTVLAGEALDKGATFKFGEPFPGKSVRAEGNGLPALAFYWLKEEGRLRTFFLSRQSSEPPSYYRWPALFDQFGWGATLAWNTHGTSGLEMAKEGGQPVMRLWWMKDGGAEETKWASVQGIFAISVAQSPEELQSRIAAHQNPLNLAAEDGAFYGYDDLEGCYMVRKVGDIVKVILPRDDLSRQAVVKVFGLSRKGAVVVKLDGKEALPDLVSDGGIVDDPLVPMQVQPHAPATECVLTVKLSPDREHTVTVEERPGVQFTYQAAYQSLDQKRNWVLFSDKSAQRGNLEMSAMDGRARNITAWGKNEEAVTEQAMFWFGYCGQSASDFLNQTRDLEIIKNGPDEVEFYYRGTNPSDRAQSEFWVTIPYEGEALETQIKSRFTVLQGWDRGTNQFYDVFPFEGVYPQKWWYAKVLFLDKDGHLGIYHDFDRAKNVNVFDRAEDKMYFAMYPSDRGNLLILVKSIRPAGHPVHIAVCGNYIDHHLDLELGQPPIQAGSVYDVDFDLAYYGNASTTQEELAEIGRKSLEAGYFVFPGK